MTTGGIQPGRGPGRVTIGVQRDESEEELRGAGAPEGFRPISPEGFEQLKNDAKERLRESTEKTNKKGFMAKIAFGISAALIGLGLGLAPFTMGLSLFLAAGAAFGLSASYQKINETNRALIKNEKLLEKLNDRNHRWTEETLTGLVRNLDSLE